MKSLVLLFAVVASSVLLAEGVSPDVHDPSYRKTTSYIEKGDYLDAPQHGSGLHKHSDKNPHHDDSHSHEDSSEHRRHARDADDDVETRRLGGGSYSDRRPGSSSLGSGSYHQGSSGFGSGSHHGSHGSSGLGGSHGAGFGGSHGSHGSHGSGGLGGSHSGLGSGALHSGSHRPGSGLGSGSFYQGSSGSGHNRRPSSARLDNYEHRALQCNGVECTFSVKSNRHSSYVCGNRICDILNTVGSESQPSRVFECREDRTIINAPLRCPKGTRPDRSGKCRTEY